MSETVRRFTAQMVAKSYLRARFDLSLTSELASTGMTDGWVVAANAANGAACLRRTSNAQAASCTSLSCWLALLGLRLAWPVVTQACPARSSLTFDRRSSSEHLLGMLVVWPVRFATYPTEGGEVCRHRSPACGR